MSQVGDKVRPVRTRVGERGRETRRTLRILVQGNCTRIVHPHQLTAHSSAHRSRSYSRRGHQVTYPADPGILKTVESPICPRSTQTHIPVDPCPPSRSPRRECFSRSAVPTLLQDLGTAIGICARDRMNSFLCVWDNLSVGATGPVSNEEGDGGGSTETRVSRTSLPP